MALRNTAGFWPVAAALGGNLLVTISKFFAAILSGSSVMFSEAVHSAADTFNQVLLLIGLKRSMKKADMSFEYGYGNERFFWALISACGVFFVGAGVTAYKGVLTLFDPQPIEFSNIIFGVLALSFVVELYTFRLAARAIAAMDKRLTFRERLAQADPMTLAVFLEDAVAVVGVCIAAAALGLAYYTDNVLWDALGSLFIAALLGGIAVVLIIKNRAYLIGRALPEETQQEIIEFLRKDPAIERVIDFKSNSVGWGAYRIKCEVEFNGNALLRSAYRGSSMKDQFDEVHNDFEEFKRFSVNFADRIPRLIGKKIDDIEKKIKERHPQIRHIDLEVN